MSDTNSLKEPLSGGADLEPVDAPGDNGQPAQSPMDTASSVATPPPPEASGPQTRLAPEAGLSEAEPALAAPASSQSLSARQSPATLVAESSVWPRLALDVFLCLLIAIGVYFRFAWVDWNQGADLHPDEYGLTAHLTQISMPKSVDEWFNTRLSPMSFYDKYDENGQRTQPGPDNRMRWGQWPLILIRWAAEQTGNTGYNDLRTLGRQLSALFDVGALVLIFLIGRRLYNRRIGLIAAALSALAVMQIQQSHFMTSDNFAAFFTTLAMYCAVRAAQLGPGASARSAHVPREAPLWGADPSANGEARPKRSPQDAVGEQPTPGRWQRDWVWYALFGVACGMAIASRINLAPLLGMIALSAFIVNFAKHPSGVERLQKACPERSRRDDLVGVFVDAGMRVGLALVAAALTFRITQPATFRAETGDTGFFTFNPNPDWAASMEVAQAESSGVGGGPPGDQWAYRPALVFPFVNMVLWGMGLPLGLAAWAGLLWALWRTVKDQTREAWRAHLLPLVWAGGYFLFMGTRWVMSIRYFLPIYPFLALFAAWALFEVWRLSRKDTGTEGNSKELKELALSRSSRSSLSSLSSLSYFLFAAVTLGTLAWAWGFTSIYRHDNTRIQASRWIYENIPGPFNLHFDTNDGPRTEPLPLPGGLPITEAPYRMQFTAPASGRLTGLTLGHALVVTHGEPKSNRSASPGAASVMRVVLASDPDGQQILAQADVPVPVPVDREAPLQGAADPRGERVSAAFGPAAITQGQIYYLFASAAPGTAIHVTGAAVTNESWDEGLPLRVDGRDAFGGLYGGLTMEVRWGDDENKRQMFLENLAQADYLFLPSQRGLWTPTRLPNTFPLTREYYRALFDGRLGFELAAHFQSPLRLGPLQISDLVGAVSWGRAPTVPRPGDFFNYSLLSAEEAFSVYDHAPVWIFRKRADFSLSQAQAALESVDLSLVIPQGPRDATRTPPTRLMLPEDRLEATRAGGTWREMFNADSLLNKSQPLGVVVWWLTLLLMGWAAFPLTWAVFGGLADRGYPLARTVSLLVLAWFVWFLASFKILPHTRGTILLGLLVLAGISGFIAWVRRAEFAEYLRQHRKHILIVEGVFLAFFLFDLAIRFGNPDLWHPYFGGEKPMDFSYFNAVLKSLYFPPYDPWLAGGYINYYYYGYVIVGAPLKLLGLTPAFGYNLILPSLFALLGINAFCAAYNLAASANPKSSQIPEAEHRGQEPNPKLGPQPESIEQPDLLSQQAEITSAGTIVGDPPSAIGHQPSAVATRSVQSPISNLHAQRPITNYRLPREASASPNPYLAGIAAALLVVVLGNLGQAPFLARGFQRAADRQALAQSLFGDNDLTATVNGVWRVLLDQADIPVGLGSWYWDATRIISTEESEQSSKIPFRGQAAGGEGRHGNEINEFPFFTFLYADLHAHMIDLPFTVLALTWAAAYFLGVKRQRAWFETLALWAVGGLAFGVTRPTNTWDYPVYLALAAVAIFAAHWAKDDYRFTRRMFFDAGWRLALLVGLATAFYRPYDQWFASGYTEFELWKGPKTPLNAYLYVHGLFLFVLTTFLAWETRRWLAETPAAILAEASNWLPMLAFALLTFVLVVGLFLYQGAETASLSLPLMTWTGLLLLRSPDKMPPEKRVVLFLFGTALAITLFVEVVVLKGDIGRQNTIFKFYLQVWVMLSVAAGAALAWAWTALPEWKPSWQTGWTAALMALTAGAALYTVTAANAKIQDRFPPRTAAESADPGVDCKVIPGMAVPYPNNRSLPVEDQPHTLDGLAYMTWSAYCDHGYFFPLVYDYEAIRWMQDNAPGSPVIVEAQSFDLYRMSSRYAWNTGLPDVVGWDWHQRQQRAVLPTDFIQRRGVETSAFYETPDLDEARAFLREYAVRYVVVGPMERAYYPAEGLAKLNALAAQGELEVAYQNPGVTIYAVP